MELTNGLKKEMKAIEKVYNDQQTEIHRLRAENQELKKFKEKFEQIQKALGK